MTDLDDLIARLREATGDKAFLSARTIVACHEAAAALEALRDEVARLRADHGEGPAEIDEETLAAMMRNARKCAEAQDRAAREWEAMNRPPLTDQ